MLKSIAFVASAVAIGYAIAFAIDPDAAIHAAEKIAAMFQTATAQLSEA